MPNSHVELWELWYPAAGATGMLIARSKIDATDIAWTHAAPDLLSVTVRDLDGNVIAKGSNLEREGERLPMTRLVREGERIRREDRWPAEGDLGSVVILPGGEAAILKTWWHAADAREWRWQVEFSNRVED